MSSYIDDTSLSLILNRRDEYLNYSKKFSSEERDYRNIFENWLPKNIIDCHSHCNRRKDVISITKETSIHMMSTFAFFDLNSSKEWHKRLHPSKTIRSLRFNLPFKGLDHKNANEYLISKTNEHDLVALFGLPEDINYTCEMLEHPKISALKMYHSYVQPQAKHIYEYFPKEVLKKTVKLDKPIILHTPLRLPQCIEQVLQVVAEFPNLRICIAHMGLTKELIPGLLEAYKSLKPYRQIYLDTSLVPSKEVISAAMSIFGNDRIMYGSDEPLNLIRARNYTHKQYGQRLMSNFPYHWLNKEEQRDSFNDLDTSRIIAHSHWNSLMAIKEAVEEFYKGESEQNLAKVNIFRNNAKLFYKF